MGSLRLWVRLVLTMAFIGVAPLLLLGWIIGVSASETAVERAKESLDREVVQQAQAVGRWTGDQLTYLDGWTQLYPTRLTEHGTELQEGLLRAVYLAMPSAVVVALVDSEGLPRVPPLFLASSDERTTADGDRAQQMLRRLPITEAIASGVAAGTAYRPDRNAVPSVPLAALATPVAGLTPDEILLLGVEVEIDVLAPLMESTGDDRAFVLLNGRGDVLMGGEHPLVDVQMLRPLSAVAVQGVVNFQYRDGDVLGSSAPVPGTEWTLVLVQPAEIVLRDARLIKQRTAVLILFVMLGALWLGWHLAQSIAQPVAQLRESVLAVAEGGFGKRTSAGGSIDMEELAKAFNHMSARLAVNQREIEEQHGQIVAFNAELQERVDRRTQQLVDAQDQLVRSGQLAAVAEIGAGLAHELNNPLSAILGLAQVLRAKEGEAQTDGALVDLEMHAQRCREVVMAMLRFASGEVDPVNAPVIDLRDVLVEATTLVGGPFRQRGVDLKLEMADTPLLVRVDPVHGGRILAQVLNALRAGLTDNATLVVSAGTVGEDVEIVLEPDTPVAIDEFRRDDWMTSGMGLWVARRLLDQLGGRLEQPLQVPWGAGARPPMTEDVMDDPSQPLLQDATWRIVLPRA